jgi:hypothetical protein
LTAPDIAQAASISFHGPNHGTVILPAPQGPLYQFTLELALLLTLSHQGGKRLASHEEA